jgi:hypothetical protein
MNEIYVFRAEVMAEPRDVTGFDVEATDGHIGKVDEATYDTGASCLVVDTGLWIFGKKRMVPAGVVERVDWDDEKVYVRMSKDEIKEAPDYDGERHAADEAGYHQEVGGYYGPWTGPPV